MKETWNTINKLINKRSKTTNISSLVVDEACLTNSSEIADSMNDYFCNIGSKLSSKTLHKIGKSDRYESDCNVLLFDNRCLQ